MEYVRKKRWATYHSKKCKEYLRNDFSHECAYCKLQESEVGFVTREFFEIDHFKPQDTHDENVHKYPNLYYCCEKCNGEKSNNWSEELLDPCQDDIFSGESPAIRVGNAADGYILEAANANGTLYIDTFKLNSRYHVGIRRKRADSKNIIKEINTLIDEIIGKIQSNSNFDHISSLAERLAELRQLKQNETEMLGLDPVFEKAQEYLSNMAIQHNLVFRELDLDFEIKVGGETYLCELIIDTSTESKDSYNKRIDTEKLSAWLSLENTKVGVLFYYPHIDRMYFLPLSDLLKKSDIECCCDSKQFVIGVDNLITSV